MKRTLASIIGTRHLKNERISERCRGVRVEIEGVLGSGLLIRGRRSVDAQRRYGSRVHGIHFTNSIKQHLATQGKKAFEDRRLRIPGTQAVRYDLHKLKRVTGATGLARFVADSDANGHADRAWALFMAIEAQATMNHEPFEFTPIPARRGGTDPNDDRSIATKEWWGGRGGY